MTIIANPIYDAVFKFLMEDKKVAKILPVSYTHLTLPTTSIV